MSTKIKLGFATFGYVAVCWHCLHHPAEASQRLARPIVQTVAPALRRAEPSSPPVAPRPSIAAPEVPSRPPLEAVVTTVGVDDRSPVQRALDALTGSSSVKFAAGSDQIDPASFALLDGIAAALRRSPQECFVELHGHTDSVGNAAVNRDMGARRAAAVARYLAHHGVAYARLRVIGRGAEDPIADNATPEGRERNRRIRFVVLGRCR
jgi:outer membrane protein OmpA-like peptidoglycan-associated protein